MKKVREWRGWGTRLTMTHDDKQAYHICIFQIFVATQPRSVMYLQLILIATFCLCVFVCVYFLSEVEKTYQALSNATKGNIATSSSSSSSSSAVPFAQSSSGIAYSNHNNHNMNNNKNPSRLKAAKNLRIHTTFPATSGSAAGPDMSSASSVSQHPDAPITAADVRDALTRGDWEVRLADLGKEGGRRGEEGWRSLCMWRTGT